MIHPAALSRYFGAVSAIRSKHVPGIIPHGRTPAPSDREPARHELLAATQHSRKMKVQRVAIARFCANQWPSQLQLCTLIGEKPRRVTRRHCQLPTGKKQEETCRTDPSRPERYTKCTTRTARCALRCASSLALSRVSEQQSTPISISVVYLMTIEVQITCYRYQHLTGLTTDMR
jgi:hypothetical protein